MRLLESEARSSFTKHEPASDIDAAAVNSLEVLDSAGRLEKQLRLFSGHDAF